MPRSLLRPVAAIDLDVTFGEVASEKPRFTPILPVHDDVDSNLALVQPFLQTGLIEICSQPFRAHQHTLQENVDSSQIERNACVPASRQNAAPVRITAGDRRLD